MRKTSSVLPCIAIFLSGCSYFIADPAEIGDVAHCADVLITPPCHKKLQEEAPCADISKPLALGDLIDIGLTNNPQTSATWAAAKTQAFALYAARSAYLPNIVLAEDGISNEFESRTKAGVLSAGGAAASAIDQLNNTTGTTGSSTGGQGYSQSWEQNLSINYLVFDFGTRSATVEAAKQALENANWTHHFTLQTVIFNVASAYYDYLEAREFVLSNEKNLESAKLAYDASQAQFEAGVNSRVDVLQAQSNYYNAVLNLQNSKSTEKITMAKLDGAIGMPADTVLQIENIPYELEPQPLGEGIEKLMAYARKERADLAALEATFWQKKAELNIAKGQALPTVSADISLNKTRYSQSPILKSSHDYLAALVIDIPVFQGFFDYNNIRRASADLENAYYNWLEAEETVLVSVVNAYYVYYNSNENLTTSKEYLRFAEESFAATLESYKDGVQTMVALIQSQNVLADARSRYIQARAEWLRSIINVAYTTGIIGIDNDHLPMQGRVPKVEEQE